MLSPIGVLLRNVEAPLRLVLMPLKRSIEYMLMKSNAKP